MTIIPLNLPFLPASRRFRTRSGLLARCSLLPKEHWSWGFLDQFVVDGKVTVTTDGHETDVASRWRLDGSWAARGEHDYDLVEAV